MKSPRRVVVTGMGSLSALGEGADQLFDRLASGASGIRKLERLDEPALKVKWGGDVAEVALDLASRDEVLASRAIDAALAEAQLEPAATSLQWACGLDTFRTPVETPIYVSAGKCFQKIAARHAAPRRMFAVACASGTRSIGEAFHLIREGRIDAAVAGGSSVMLTPFYLIGFSALGAISSDHCRPFDANRSGFALADGAGALALESLDVATARGAKPLAEILGFGSSQDAFDLNRPPDDGRGALECMRRTLLDAGRAPEDIDAVNAHGTGTYIGDIAETAALRELLGERSSEVPVHSAKGAIGHAMAAAGALEAIIAVKTAATGVVPPTVNLNKPDEACALRHVVGEPASVDAKLVLSESFGMGGQNAALLIGRI